MIVAYTSTFIQANEKLDEEQDQGKAAEKYLGDSIDYISADNPAAAFKVAARIEKNILKLENFPLSSAVPRIRRLAEIRHILSGEVFLRPLDASRPCSEDMLL